MQSWVKAGLLGGLAGVLLTLPGYASYFVSLNIALILSLCLCLPFFLVYPLSGILAAHWLTLPGTARQGASAGTMAGLLASIIDSFFTILVTVIFAVMGLIESYAYQQLSTRGLEFAQESGMWSLVTPGSQVIQSLCLSIFNIFLGISLGCLGGLFYALIRRNR
jgi:hypothetical protein